MKRTRGRHNHFLRRFSEVLLEAALLNGFVAKCSYQCGLQGLLRVRRYEVALAGSTRLPKPLKLAFASDFHAGPTTHPEVFRQLFDQIANLQPDLLLLGGDFISGRESHAQVLCDALAACNPPLGKFAVLGNHDLWADDARLVRRLGEAGVHVLINANTPLAIPFECVSICGIDDPWTGSARAEPTFGGANPVRIYLTHSPEGLLFLGEERFDVAFAGHTHGGQVALRDGTPLVLPGGPLCRTYSRGRFEIAGNGPLIVSVGVGCSTLPIRINADPELVLCTLH